ncbi:MAG: hypothetical protein NVSMB27_22710 [Ktedonobacteraceae bacterium]
MSEPFFILLDDSVVAIDDSKHVGSPYDIVPATELGYTTVWVNRQGHGRPGRVKETFLVGDMQTLAYLVKGIAASS